MACNFSAAAAGQAKHFSRTAAAHLVSLRLTRIQSPSAIPTLAHESTVSAPPGVRAIRFSVPGLPWPGALLYFRRNRPPAGRRAASCRAAPPLPPPPSWRAARLRAGRTGSAARRTRSAGCAPRPRSAAARCTAIPSSPLLSVAPLGDFARVYIGYRAYLCRGRPRAFIASPWNPG